MIDDPEREKFDAMAALIQQAKDSSEPHKKVVANDTEEEKTGNPGFELGGAILGGMFIGWLIDKQFGTSPWGIVGGIILGFVAGMMGIYRGLSGSGK